MYQATNGTILIKYFSDMIPKDLAQSPRNLNLNKPFFTILCLVGPYLVCNKMKNYHSSIFYSEKALMLPDMAMEGREMQKSANLDFDFRGIMQVLMHQIKEVFDSNFSDFYPGISHFMNRF